MDTHQDMRAVPVLSIGQETWANLERQIALILEQQAQLTKLVIASLNQGKTDRRKSKLKQAIDLLPKLGSNTAAIARKLKIKRTTLDSWEEFRRVRNEFAKLEAQDKETRKKKLRGQAPTDDEDGE